MGNKKSFIEGKSDLIDIEKAFFDKSPILYKFIPKFIFRKLKKIIHQQELNKIINTYREKKGLDFSNCGLNHMGVKTKSIGTDNIPKTGGVIVVANHPLGGLDGVAIINEVGKIREDVHILVNDILLQIENFKPIFVPINKHGKNSRTNLSQIDNLYKSIKPVSASGMKIEDRPILVGKSYEGSTGDNGTFSGSMDDLMFFDKKLSALEFDLIYKSYQSQKTLPDHNLVKQHWIENHPKTVALEKQLKNSRKQWLKTFSPVLEVMVMEELPQSRKTYLYSRGNYDEPAYEVNAAVPEKLPAMDPELPKNRLGLAKWLFDQKNPLTARVAVNRYWQMIFGRGLVQTSTDFGVQGALPSHPDLLDALALEFMESNWDIKQLIKKMVLSKTYRQTSKASPELLERDPKNIFLARSNRYRLPAEMIRDNALATSGLLVNQIGGESVKPYQPEGLWKEKSTFSLRLYDYKTTKGDSLYRRSLYTFIRRTSPPPSMIAFDATSREVCTVQRENTSTPLQALVLLNDIQFFEASRVLAERIQREAGTKVEDQIKYGFRLATSRHPSDKEIAILKDLYNTQLTFYRKDVRAARKTIRVGEKAIDYKFNPVKTAALTMVANTLLNHNETFVKY